MLGRTRLIGRVVLACVLLFSVVSTYAQQVLRMSTTTSTDNSGLLTYLLPKFTSETGIKVQVIAVGTGKALELARNGDVDVTLVHARDAELKFVASGYGVQRRDVMYNDFVVVGPRSDPAGLRGSHEVLAAFSKLIDKKAKFISRGDASGTEIMEQSYWKLIGYKPQGKLYVSAGQGMGEVLMMADQLEAYTLSDRATFAAFRGKTSLELMVEGDQRMFNPYGIIAVNPAKYPDTHFKEAMRLIEWISSYHGQQLIESFRVDGQQVFFPSTQTQPEP